MTSGIFPEQGFSVWGLGMQQQWVTLFGSLLAGLKTLPVLQLPAVGSPLGWLEVKRLEELPLAGESLPTPPPSLPLPTSRHPCALHHGVFALANSKSRMGKFTNTTHFCSLSQP